MGGGPGAQRQREREPWKPSWLGEGEQREKWSLHRRAPDGQLGGAERRQAWTRRRGNPSRWTWWKMGKERDKAMNSGSRSGSTAVEGAPLQEGQGPDLL